MTKQVQRPAILAMTAALIVAASSVQATVWIVDPGGAGDFTTIQDAVNAAATGDTISISPDTYEEQVQVSVAVTLSGSGVGATILRAPTSMTFSFSASTLRTTSA